jgi:glycerol-3-phosphate dehydrogenase
LNFSPLYRPEIINKLKGEIFDLLIIGGGITGAGIALDAASRGLKVALVEKNDFAYGTSSRSTKLIHGGLRYLKQLEFGLVKEVGSERAVVHDLAPHLVVPEKMLLPLHEKKGLGYWLTSIGLKLYDWLAGVKPEDQRRMLTRSQTLKAEPLLRADGIKGGALYAEYRTDDARLTVEIIKAAVANGATILNYVEASEFLLSGNKISGAVVADILNLETFPITATSIVNAAGPWVDDLRKANQSLSGKRLHLTKGVHIVVRRSKLPVHQAIYFDVDDGRMIFAIPRGRTTYIGTTDTTYEESKDEVFTSKDDAEYLVKAVNSTFPRVNLQLSDIESCWAGLRPLIHEDGKSASELSRKDEIFESPTGLISIAGGKLTGYRKMAERVVNLVVKKYFSDKNLPACKTQSLKLPGAGFKNEKERKKYEDRMVGDLAREGIPGYRVRALVENFGTQCASILNNYLSASQEKNPETRLLKATLEFCIEHEMVITLADFFVRRTGMLYFDIHLVIQYKDYVASYMSRTLSWDSSRVTMELHKLEYLIERAQLKHIISE